MSSPIPDREFPDAELIVQAGIRGFDPAWKVVTDTPADMTGVVVQVTRIGGSGIPGFVDRARLDVDVFAPSREAASAAARTVAAKLPTLRGQTIAGGRITDVRQDTGVAWRPYSNTGVRRFGLTVNVSIKPI